MAFEYCYSRLPETARGVRTVRSGRFGALAAAPRKRRFDHDREHSPWRLITQCRKAAVALTAVRH
jgi:hypothetical protein